MSEPIDRIREYFKPSELCLKVDWMTKENARINSMIDDIEDENAKLRELVRDMWFADYAGHFSTLPEHQEHQATVWQRMCELGIEVD